MKPKENNKTLGNIKLSGECSASNMHPVGRSKNVWSLNKKQRTQHFKSTLRERLE